jgi:putative endopeptidase
MAMFRTRTLASLFALAIALSVAVAEQNTSVQDIDRSIKPGDDFYHYANGTWLRTVQISADLPSYDTRAILVARTSQRVRDLIQEAAAVQSPKDGVARKVGDFYASFTDESGIESKGLPTKACFQPTLAAP